MRLLPAVLLLALLLPARAGDDPPPVNAGTESGRALTAPPVREGFSFVIFGDRTSGKPAGLKLLDRAVEVSNRLDPDFVMTVGDMVQGYTSGARWLAQVKEYKAHMAKLRAPWYPVVGNHDVYGGRANRKEGNVALYKEHIGPLYYSFDYRFGHFVALFSDEMLSFRNPAKTQNMSERQMAWLREDLAATRAKHVFLFLHHPRWDYRGTNWPAVHEILEADGRVRAVFAGHLHQYRDDGVRDGIHYFVLAVTGGGQGPFPMTAGMHHIHLVKVRKDDFTVATLPMGSVVGSNAVLGSELDRMYALRSGAWLRSAGTVDVRWEGDSKASLRTEIENPTDRAVGYSLEWTGPEGWSFAPAELAGTLEPGQTLTQTAEVEGPAFAGRLPEVRLGGTLHFEMESGLVQPIHHAVRVKARLVGVPRDRRDAARKNRVLALDGKSAVRVPLPRSTGPFTLECWAKGERPAGRHALVSKMDRSGFGIWWCHDGKPRAYGGVFMDKFPGRPRAGFVDAAASEDWDFGAWTHLAQTWDGRVARFFVDGRPAAEAPAPGERIGNGHPLMIGADPDERGVPGYFFKGEIDEVRLSAEARYSGPFRPRKVFRADRETVALFHFDRDDGVFFADDSGNDRHGWPAGKPVAVEAER